MVVFCSSCPTDKTFWALCKLELSLCLLPGKFPLPIQMSVGVMGSLVAWIPEVFNGSVVPHSSFTHPFLRTWSGLGAIRDTWRLHIGFLASSLFTLGVYITSSLTLSVFFSKDLFRM